MLKVDNFLNSLTPNRPSNFKPESTTDGITQHSMALNPESGRFDTHGDSYSPEVHLRVRATNPQTIEESISANNSPNVLSSRSPKINVFNP